MLEPSLLRACVLAAGCALAAAPAAAQGDIAVGQTVSGTLDSAAPVMEDGSHYHVWRFRGEAGQRLVVTLRSDDFDAFLMVGERAGDACLEAEFCEVDDDGAGGTDARVRLVLPHTGTFEIGANTYGAGDTGRYTLTLEELPPPQPPRGELRVGRSVTGELDARDDQTEAGSYFETWTFRARAGERLVLDLVSPDFDAYLVWGRQTGGRWEPLGDDDDGGEGTDSRLEIVIPEDGIYHVRAGSFFEGETGRYTLTLGRG
jgi:hypothetical protein